MNKNDFERLIMSDSREKFEKWLDENHLFDTSNFIHDEKERALSIENNITWKAWQAATEQQQSVIAELVEALDMLDTTKEYKLKIGKDEVYESMRAKAWNNAEALLAKVKGVKSE
jgi:hypothetical protein